MGGANFQVYHGRHPNVVEIKKVMAAKQKIFFAMAARKNFQLLVIALKLCHNHGVSHCDLKLENLLLDFGLSALPEHHLNDGLIHMQCGAPAYTSLEVMWKKGYDGAQANIWSCSVIITNAFKFISSISSGFDLSNLFENGQCPTIVVVSISPEMQSV